MLFQFGVICFGMLIPMSAMESEGYLLPVIFALATGLPVMLVAWILAYSVAGKSFITVCRLFRSGLITW